MHCLFVFFSFSVDSSLSLRYNDNDTYTCTQGMLTGTMEADGTQWTVTGLLREFNTTSRIMLSLEFLPAEYDPDATPAWLVIGPDVTSGELREAYEAYYGVTEGE